MKAIGCHQSVCFCARMVPSLILELSVSTWKRPSLIGITSASAVVMAFLSVSMAF